MSGWIKLEKRKVTEKRDNAIFKTKVVGYEWFAIQAQPQQYVEDSTGHMWVATTDYHFGKDKPQ